MTPPEVRRHLLRQNGVLSRAQALEGGVTRRQIDRLLASGEWRRVHPGVFHLVSVVPTPESSVRAAALWLGPGALLSGLGAAWWWQHVDEPPARWLFTTSGRTHARTAPGLRVTRSFLDPRDCTTRIDLPVVSSALAVLRAAVELETERAGAGIGLLDRVGQRRTVTAADLESTFQRHRGTAGTTAMRRLLDRTGDGAHSELERLAVRLLRAAGITGFVVNHRTRLPSGRPVELDIAFVDRRLALELDGYAYHSSPEAHREDLRRANEVMAAGWVVRRFTYRDLVTDPDGFVAVVRSLLA